MPVIEEIAGFAEDLTTIRRDIHEHPELGFQEVRTSGIVAQKLKDWGIEVTTGLGKTGVIGVLKLYHIFPQAVLLGGRTTAGASAWKGGT